MAWTWRTPAWTAAIELATASSASLWVWMPQVTAGRARVALERAPDVAQDPHQLVGQRAAVGVAQDEASGAPASRAARSVASA